MKRNSLSSKIPCFFICVFVLAIANCNTPENPSSPTSIYTIQYDLNGGTWIQDTVITCYTATENVILPTAYNLRRTNYIFDGWYDNSRFEGEIITGWNAGEKTESIKLYAKWVLNYDQFDLPLISIEIPDNKEIDTKTWLEDQKIALAEMKIVDKNDPSNDMSVKLDIKGRGNTSWDVVSKKCYSIKLDKKKNLFGMANGEHKNYALIANYSDKTLIRNQLAYYMGTDMFTDMAWNTHTKQVNLFINGIYRGVYLLVERIKIHENEVNIKNVNKTAIFSDGGWIVEINWRLDEIYNWKTSQKIKVSLVEPDDYVGWELIKNHIDSVESVLYDDSLWLDKDNGWRKYLDEKSFIDWYWVNEISRNPDAHWWCSVYLYYDPSNKKLHMGPLWDFDIGFGNINYDGHGVPEDFFIKNDGWHKRLFDDPEFAQNVLARWDEKKLAVYDLLNKIDTLAGRLENDAALNFVLYPILGVKVWPNPDGFENRTTYQSEVDFLKNWLNTRINWLDTHL